MISVTRPSSISTLSDAQIMDPAFQVDGAGSASPLGLGFALRLVRGLAQLAAGSLRLTPAQFQLTLPASKQ